MVNVAKSTLNKLQHEWLLNPDILYLNHAAVSPWPKRTVEAVTRFAQENAHVGSQRYLEWIEVETGLKQKISTLINAPSRDDIALVKNTSEGLSIVAYGLEWSAGDNIVISNEEFPSNRIVWESLRRFGVEVREVDLSLHETPEQSLISACDKNTKLLSISSTQYASGLVIDLNPLGVFCKNNGVLFCVDAIQTVGAQAMNVAADDIDFLMADGHKWMLGPEGLGFLYCRASLRDTLKLNQYGWHMVEQYSDFTRKDWSPAASARRFECGSPNMLGIHALDASLSLLLELGLDVVKAHVLERTRLLMRLVDESRYLERISSDAEGRYLGIATFRHRKLNAESLFSKLKENGVMCAARGGGIRFSPHYYTPDEVLVRAVAYADQNF